MMVDLLLSAVSAWLKTEDGNVAGRGSVPVLQVACWLAGLHIVLRLG